MLTAEMLAPVITAVNDNIAVVIPAGIGVFATLRALTVGLGLFKSLLHS